MTEVSERQSPDEILAKAQIDKINLEIEDLRRKRHWGERATKYLSSLTALVAVGGFLFGIYQFIGEQRKDRANKEKEQTTRIQDQIRADVDQLLQFTNDDRQTVSRAIFILEDLEYLSEYPVNERQKLSDIRPDLKRRITESLVAMIENDCDFINKPRDVNFSNAVIDHWRDYSAFIKSNEGMLRTFLYKHIRALRDLHQKSPTYFEELKIDPTTQDYDVDSKKESGKEENQFQHYGTLVYGFDQLLNFARENIKLRTKYVSDFKDALKNPCLTNQLFGTNFLTITDCPR